MGGSEVPLEAAGGVQDERDALGTDAALVGQAIERAGSEDGVLVLMDLGSAVMRAEMAVDMLGDDQRDGVLLSEAPLVEGAVAAAAAARAGGSLEDVAREARAGLRMKASHLGSEEGDSAEATEEAPARMEGPEVRLQVENPLVLHARPAARFVETASRYDVEVSVLNETTGRGPASGRSLTALGALGVRQGHEIRVSAQGAQVEWRRLEEAIAAAREDLRHAREAVAEQAGDDAAGILEAHLLMLEDSALLEPAREAIFEEGRNAAQSWQAAAERAAADYRALDDDYLRERAADVLDVSRRVVGHLAGDGSPATALRGAGILVARELTPGQAAGLDREVVRGIATAHGGPTSHAAILSRALGIPAVVGLGEGVLAIGEGTTVVLDGDAGVLHVDPPPERREELERRRRAEEERRRAARTRAHEPAGTRDGQHIEVMANLGSPHEAAAALEAGGGGGGVLRPP